MQGFRPPRHARLSDGRALQCHPRGADIQVVRGVGTGLETLERHDPPPATPAEVGALMQRILGLLHDLHAVPSEEEVSRRFVQQQ